MLLSALRLTRICLRATWLAGVMALIVLSAGPSVLRFAGFETYTVRGGSMAPAIPIGSIVVVERVAPSSISAGDVVTFRAANEVVVTHRVLGRSAGPEPTFITRGDSNPGPDPDLISSTALIGRVAIAVPVIGSALVSLSSTTGMVVVVLLLGSILLAGWFIDELRTAMAANSRRSATELAL